MILSPGKKREHVKRSNMVQENLELPDNVTVDNAINIITEHGNLPDGILDLCLPGGASAPGDMTLGQLRQIWKDEPE